MVGAAGVLAALPSFLSFLLGFFVVGFVVVVRDFGSLLLSFLTLEDDDDDPAALLFLAGVIAGCE